MKYLRTAAIWAACLLGSACSIKEAREVCPCRLDILLEECLPLTREVTLSAWSDGRVFTQALTVADYPEVYSRWVPKGKLRLTALSGVREEACQEGEWILPRGSACDSIWTCTAEVDCRGETSSVIIMLKQQFATVHLSINDLAPDEEYPYRLILRSQVDGLSLTDCQPDEGEWSRTILQNREGRYVFRIPRQQDGSLKLDMLLEGRKADSFPVGEHILKSGYDWTADRLADIYIGMDYGGTETHIRIEPWENGNVYESII